MPNKAPQFCGHHGCPELTNKRYCPEHMAEYEEKQKQAQAGYERKRGSAQARGYGSRWQKYSQGFLRRPGNQLCKLHIDDGCAIVAQCVDHIDPPSGPDDPRFWDRSNHQPACIHCNSVKGHKKMLGSYDMMERIEGNLCKRK